MASRIECVNEHKQTNLIITVDFFMFLWREQESSQKMELSMIG